MPRYLIVAKATSICGWVIEAEDAKTARQIAEIDGPNWSELDFDEPDDFEITKIKRKET